MVTEPLQGGQGTVPKACSPSPWCFQRLFPKAELSWMLSCSSPCMDCSELCVCPCSEDPPAWGKPGHLQILGSRMTCCCCCCGIFHAQNSQDNPSELFLMAQFLLPSCLLTDKYNSTKRPKKQTKKTQKNPSLTAPASERKLLLFLWCLSFSSPNPSSTKQISALF